MRHSSANGKELIIPEYNVRLTAQLGSKLYSKQRQCTKEQGLAGRKSFAGALGVNGSTCHRGHPCLVAEVYVLNRSSRLERSLNTEIQSTCLSFDVFLAGVQNPNVTCLFLRLKNGSNSRMYCTCTFQSCCLCCPYRRRFNSQILNKSVCRRRHLFYRASRRASRRCA